MNILAVIQARGGSKSLSRKNILPLAGKPLIAWTIEAAQKAKSINRLVVSTDDLEITEVARCFGAEVPYQQPAELATDNIKSVRFLKYALEWLAKHDNYQPDILVQLKPTNPTRTTEHIELAITEYLKYHPNIDSLITLTRSPAHPLKTYRFRGNFVLPFVPGELFGLEEASKMPRQSLPDAYVQNSCVNIINCRTIFEKDSSLGTKVVGLVMKREDSVNIDDQLDFDIAEMIIQKRLTAK